MNDYSIQALKTDKIVLFQLQLDHIEPGALEVLCSLYGSELSLKRKCEKSRFELVGVRQK